jgi:hypothetical protein
MKCVDLKKEAQIKYPEVDIPSRDDGHIGEAHGVTHRFHHVPVCTKHVQCKKNNYVVNLWI